MATESNNIQINSFGKGMNSDTSFDTIQEGQYIFGENVRITTNTLLGAIIDSNSTEGIITPIDEGNDVTPGSMYKGEYRILATASIDNIGAVIIADNKRWYVYRVDFGDTITYSLQFTSEEIPDINNIKKFSVVINREMENIVKLYIADGIHQLMQINIVDDDYNSKISGNTDNITSNHIYPSVQAKIQKQIAGSLKTSQVQYTYRLYKRFGISSKLAPLTNKIQIIDGNRNKEEGNAQDTVTSIGLQISIPINELEITKNVFDHVQVFRLSYIKPQEDAQVDLIYDSFIRDTNLLIRDDGNTSLKSFSIDEFSAINSMIIVPQNIEQTQNYMFVSNIKDETILRMDKENIDIDSRAYQRRIHKDGNGIVLRGNNDPLRPENHKYYNEVSDIQDPQFATNPFSIMNPSIGDNIYDDWQACRYKREGTNYYWGGEGKNVSWKFVTTNIAIHDKFNQYSPNPPYSTGNQGASQLYYINHVNNLIASNLTTNDYLGQHGIFAMKSLEYDDIIGSSMFRSLRRDEVYRYGIVYYDKYGKRSDVQWIGDIRTPRLEECPSTTATKSVNTSDDRTVEGNFYQEVEFILRGKKGDDLFNEEDEWESFNFNFENINKNETIYVPKGHTAEFKITSVGLTGINVLNANDSLTTYPIIIEVPGQHKHDKTLKDLNDALSEYVTINTVGKIYIDGVMYNQDTTVPIEQDTNINVGIPSVNITNYNIKGVQARELYGKICNFFNEQPKAPIDPPGQTTGFGESKYRILTHFCYHYKLIIKDSNINSVVKLDSNPLGIKFDISIPQSSNITSYQIVRCSKQSEYSKTLMQCALSRPICQKYSGFGTSARLNSPYYPTPLLQSQPIWTYAYMQNVNTDFSRYLFQLHASEISIFPNDAQSLISKNDSVLKPRSFRFQGDLYTLTYALGGFITPKPVFSYNEWGVYFDRANAVGAAGTEAMDFKAGSTCNLYYYDNIFDMKYKDNWNYNKDAVLIEEVSNVQTPTWEKGFSNIQFSGSAIIGGVKAYKSYVSTVKTDQYVNWVCNGMYNLRISNKESQSGTGSGDIKAFTYYDSEDGDSNSRGWNARGWIGPGPQCLLARLSLKDSDRIFNNSITHESLGWQQTVGSLICDVQHTPQQFAGFSDNEKQFDIYYGFGNYGKLTPDGHGNMVGSLIVFDGDVYNLPCELVSMYKTYNFNSVNDSIPSAQVVNYIPLETKINTFFDYGMNYRNTKSPNLQIEPGEITGVCSQDRPQHQYNPIYSDNNVSNDVYNAKSEEWHDQNFPQRIFYSLLKTNGEAVDNWSDFRALNYIDADTRYGDITHMLTDKDVLYFWQQKAFGKLSVNERSLVTDNNSNTIQLGQGGVLQRTDYISTVYGIRKNDRSAINTQDGLFWIDIVNKAILVHKGGQIVNYGEILNVQNIINSNINDSIPSIEYDYQNQELLCKCLNNNKQLVFNTKLGCATSVYTRSYDDTIKYNNVVYGLTSDCKMIQYNYLNNSTSKMHSVLEFIVNQIPTTTKVFDNQQINTLKREYNVDYAKNFMSTKQFVFTTNLDESCYDGQQNVITDREGNICYTIPRIGNSLYGNRLRGRWMKVKMVDNDPDDDYSISHVLTKFRQSFN